MTAILYILLAIIIAVAIWQVASIFNLKGAIAIEKDNNTQGILFALFGIFFYGLMIFSFWKYAVILLPDSASIEGESYDTLYLVTMLLILFVQAVTQFLLFYFAFKYRGVKGRKALFYADSHKLELIWTVIPAVVLAGLVLYGQIFYILGAISWTAVGFYWNDKAVMLGSVIPATATALSLAQKLIQLV